MMTGDLVGKKNTSRKKNVSRKRAVSKKIKKKVTKAKKPQIKKKPKKTAPKVKKPVKKLKDSEIIEFKPPTIKQKEDMKKIIGILGDAYIRQMLIDIGGENALAIVRNFYGNHSDEELAKKLKIKISDVRATLNKLHNEGLVNYIRQKDNETGWYSYSWSLNKERMERWASDQSDKIGCFGNGDGENYYCPSCGAATISGFEDAAAGDFRCCQCNRMLEFLDKTKVIEIFEKRRL